MLGGAERRVLREVERIWEWVAEEGEGGEAVRFRFGVRCLAEGEEDGMASSSVISSTVSMEGCSTTRTARSGASSSSVTCSMVSLAPMMFREEMDCEARSTSTSAEGGVHGRQETSLVILGGDEARVG